MSPGAAEAPGAAEGGGRPQARAPESGQTDEEAELLASFTGQTVTEHLSQAAGVWATPDGSRSKAQPALGTGTR